MENLDREPSFMLLQQFSQASTLDFVMRGFKINRIGLFYIVDQKKLVLDGDQKAWRSAEDRVPNWNIRRVTLRSADGAITWNVVPVTLLKIDARAEASSGVVLLNSSTMPRGGGCSALCFRPMLTPRRQTAMIAIIMIAMMTIASYITRHRRTVLVTVGRDGDPTVRWQGG